MKQISRRAWSIAASGCLIAGLVAVWYYRKEFGDAGKDYIKTALDDSELPSEWALTTWSYSYGKDLKTDHSGDPLPPGAIARLGTRRFRHGGPISAITYSQDGRYLATASNDLQVRIFEVSTGRIVRQWTMANPKIHRLLFTAADESLISVDPVQRIQIWEVATGRLLLNESMSNDTRYIHSSDGKKLVLWWHGQSGGARQFIEVIDTKTGRRLSRVDTRSPVYSLVLTPDGQSLIAGCESVISVFDVATGKEIRALKGHSANVTALAISKNGMKLASGGGWTWSGPKDQVMENWRDAANGKTIDQGAMICLWDLSNGTMEGPLSGHKSAVTALAFSPDGTTLVSGSGEGDSTGLGIPPGDTGIRVWDTDSKEIIQTLRGHKSVITDFEFACDGGRLLSKSFGHSTDDSVMVWDWAKGTPRYDVSLNRHYGTASDACLSPNGRILAIAGRKSPSRFVDLESGSERSIATIAATKHHAIAFSPDGKSVALDDGNAIRFWDVETGKSKDVFPDPIYPVRSISFKDNQTILLGSPGNAVQIWSIPGSALPKSLNGSSTATTFSLSANGKWAAAGFVDGKVKVWDMQVEREIFQVVAEGIPQSLSVSTDGVHVAGLFHPLGVRIWDLKNPTNPFSLEECVGERGWIHLSRDGSFLATDLGVWEVGTGKRNMSFGPRGMVSSAFSPDAMSIAFGGERMEKRLVLWDRASHGAVWTRRDPSIGWQTMVFSQNGQFLAVGEGGRWGGGIDSSVRVLDSKTGSELCRFEGFPLNGEGAGKAALSAAFSPDDSLLATGMGDTTVLIWDLAFALKNAAPIPIIKDEVVLGKEGGEHLYELTWIPGSQRVASGTISGLYLWEMPTGVRATPIQGLSNGVSAICATPNGRELIGSDHITGNVYKWRIEDGKESWHIQAHEHTNQLALSHDGGLLATGGDGEVALWKVNSGTKIWKEKLSSNAFASISLSPDAKTIACAGDGGVLLVDATNGKAIKWLLGHERWVSHVKFTPDGKSLASSDYRQIIVWDLEESSGSKVFPAHRSEIIGLVFLDEGRRLLSANKDGSIESWNLVTGQKLRTLHVSISEPTAMAISPDEKTLLVGGRAGICIINLH